MAITQRKLTTTLLIDDEGSVNDSRSLNLRTKLHAVQIGDAFSDYAIRNLGFVAIQPAQKSVHIRLRPSHVSPVAFAGLMYWLADQQPERVMLATLDRDDWQHQMLGNSDTAAVKIAQIVNRAQRRHDENFLAAERQIDDLAPDHPLRQLYEARAQLQDAMARLDLDLVNQVMGTHVGGRFSVSQADPELKRIVLASVGHGFAAEAGYWMRRAVGNRMEDMPDARYGAWAADTHAQAIRSGMPQLNDIDIIVQWPSEKPRRYRTKRLLLPMRDCDNRHVVLSATLPDSSIDLRASRKA